MLKVRSLNETLIREVHKLKQENVSKGKQENEQSCEEVKMKDEEICRLRNHNKTLLDEVKRLKHDKKHFQNQENIGNVDEEITKMMEVEICKKVEESLGTEDTKS